MIIFLFLLFGVLLYLGYSYNGNNGVLITLSAVFILGAFFVLQTKSLAGFYVEMAPSVAKLLK
jgi:hypothetical protein